MARQARDTVLDAIGAAHDERYPGRRPVRRVIVDASPVVDAVADPGPTWGDVRRAWVLAQASLRYAGAIYVGAVEHRHTALLTADARIGRSGAPITCETITIAPAEQDPSGTPTSTPVTTPCQFH